MNRVRGRGRRFDNEPKLNLKKVFATIVAIIVIIMVIVSIINLFNKDEKIDSEMIIPKSYFTIFESGKYGVIDETGKIIVNSIYDEMIIIPDHEKPLFICTYDVDVITGEYKTKVLNEKSQEILTKYNNVMPLENSRNNEVWYEDNILKFEKNGKYGLIDFSGKEILPAEYSNIYSLSGIQKSIVIEKDGLKGIVNSALGDIVVPCEYTEIVSLEKTTADNGYIVTTDGRVGIVSGTGKEIIPCNYQEIMSVTGNGMYVVKDDLGLKIIDKSLNIIKDGGFDSVEEINGEYITYSLGGKQGVLNGLGVNSSSI